MTTGLIVRAVSGPAVGAAASVGSGISLGRHGGLTLDDRTVSREHALVEPIDGGVRVTDLGSAAGVIVNGSRTRRVDLAPGDTFDVGATTMMVQRLQRFSDAAAEPAVRVRQHGKDRVVPVADGATIGRDEGSDVRVDDPTVSRRHAVLRIDGHRFELHDEGSANGTFVDGRAVRGVATLTDGATIRVGSAPTELIFHAGARAGSTTVRCSREGSSRVETVVIDATRNATVAEVTRELAPVVSEVDGSVLVYRNDDGTLLHPDDRWWSTGVRTGDHLVVGAGDATEFAAADGRHWPAASSNALNQLPRMIWPAPPHQVERIDAPESASFRGRGVQWQIGGGIGATLLGLALAFAKPSYAVFGIITGGIGILSIVASVMGEQSRRRHHIRSYRAKLVALDEALRSARATQAARLHELSPSNETLEAWIDGQSPRIWERRPDHPDALQPTIGIGRRPARVELERPGRSDSPLAAEYDDVIGRHRVLEGVPVSGPGRSSGSLGICGPPLSTMPLLARIVIEAALLHPPNQLSIWIVTDQPGWEWCRWLPHVGAKGVTGDVTALRLAIEGRRGRDGSHERPVHLVVVPDATRSIDVGPLLPGRDSDRLVVVAADDQRHLPSGLAAVLDVDGRSRGVVRGMYPEVPEGEFLVVGMSEQQAERIAIGLARLDAGDRSAAPSGLVELMGLGSATEPNVLGSWSRAVADRLTVPVGSDSSGELVDVGFRRDGPHGMIAGTTGSGKSELLQTVLIALALQNSPVQLNLFLVDFKGGSTFAPLAKLPHVVGLVTDLERDPSLATRAMVALDAEIERRKRVLDAARVPNVIAYERAGIDPPLPDLLVVIDEFALLVERQPEIRDRLDTIATQGRSLGVHMLLATQSPSGVISHAIRTNTNLWICLRVVVDSESLEILGAPDAARLPEHSPGRAFIRLGAAPQIRGFQAARIGRPLADPEAGVRVTPLGLRSDHRTRTPTSETTELDVVVRHIIDAATQLELPSADMLWLPPLPTNLRPHDLVVPGRPADRLVSVVGLADLPQQRQQQPFLVDLSASGHALVCGVFGAGKTTALTQIAVDLAGAYSPSDVHIFAIDGGAGSLAPLKQLPHVGDVVGSNETDRLTRLIARLTRLVEARREQLSADGVGDFLRWRPLAEGRPWHVLLVDDFAAFRETAENVEMGRLLDRFNALLQTGPSVGVHVVMGVAQSGELRGRELNLVLARLVLRAADSTDYSLVDVRLGTNHLLQLPPGRALAAGGVEVQLCQPGSEDLTAAKHVWPDSSPSSRPDRVRSLPRSVALDRLALARPGQLALGVGGAEIEQLSLPTGGDGAVVLVAGPGQSGRTSTLVTLLSSLAPDAARVLVVTPRRNALQAIAESRGYKVQAGREGIDAALDEFVAGAGAGSVLVIDDAEAISSAPGVGTRLEPLLRSATDTGVSVFVAARASDLPGMFDPWARYLLSLRRAVLLWPTVEDAFLFGCKLPAIPTPFVPGRGVLIDRAQVSVVQVAIDEHAQQGVAS